MGQKTNKKLAFAECGKREGYGVWIMCRKESTAMKNCILDRQQSKYVDEQRDLYIQRKMEKLKESS
ncbi:unnamed protein product [Kuraishia capsulata CBS 1993]|uniref:COX assembly mitochondrial protein n=1 Tax=Kuraishia capsulata CBS 1993 TaxID=1382522 RepID=W6MG36_9ASCO|nr:uncharacterized protein KUCA_T00000642001 [Kuraishia capsulata CBS 1993]CDK24676.1 unnamed protein product [Kuraishia capsulata CBS 1993]